MPEPVRKDITKQEAARRQIETAIRLFFADDDAISVHVLVSSAQVIVQDVCEARGRRSMKDYVEMHIRPEHVAEWRRKAKEAYNYFKHADWDAEIALSHFDERFNDFILFATITDYTYAFDVLPTTVMRIFLAWYIASNPNRVKSDFPGLNQILKVFDELDKLPRDLQKQEGFKLLELVPDFEKALAIAEAHKAGKA